MWYLTEINPESGWSPKYWLGGTAGRSRTIGRKHVDIRLKASSVSRTHAKITILKAAFYTPSVRRHSTSVCVQDSSAYGTFLKYPPGRTAKRGEVVGHHKRLDKDTPTDVCEDSLLAFGAPSAWWKVAWERIAACPTRLSFDERTRLDEISAATSLEISDNWSEDVTHLIANHCVPTSFKFLTAIAYDRHIVTPAWAQAVCLVVTEACKNATEVSTDEASVKVTTLPEETLFFPPFAAGNIPFPEEILTSSFEPSKRERRKALFDRIAFAFAREERRSKWALIVTQLGGCTMLAQAVKGRVDVSRVVFVREDGKESEVDNERPWMPESAVIEAVLAADLSPLQNGLEAHAVAEVTDVGTPGPLDADSDADSDVESEESEGSEPERKKHTDEESSGAHEDKTRRSVRKLIGTKRNCTENDPPRKRSRSSSLPQKVGETDGVEQEAALPPSKAVEGGSAEGTGDAAEGKDVRGAISSVEMTKINERTFFAVHGWLPPLTSDDTGDTGKRDELDVRPFRKNAPPSASVVPLKRVPVLQGGRRLVHCKGADIGEKGTRTNRRPSDTGAHLMESDEE